jgi:cytochrome c553
MSGHWVGSRYYASAQRASDQRAPAQHALSGAIVGLALLAFPCAPNHAESRVPELTGRALSSTPDTRHGEVLYQKFCAGCHRKNARGADESAVPALAGQHPSYLIKQMAAFVEFEREDSGLHRVLAQAELSRPQSLSDLGAYLGSLPVNQESKIAHGSSDAKSIAEGERLYADNCSVCHLPTAQGDAEHFLPSLRGQNYSYLLMQLRRLAHGHRFDTPDKLLAVFDAMTSAEMEAVANYLSRLPPVPTRTAAG